MCDRLRLQYVDAFFLPHRKLLQQAEWLGLPELTNADGAPCAGSCPTQAWSSATVLDTIFDLAMSHSTDGSMP